MSFKNIFGRVNSRLKAFFMAGLFSALMSPGLLAAETVYKFGVVPQFEARALAKIWLPVLHELEHRTGLTFKLVGSPRIPDFEANYQAGAFDFAYMNPYHSLVANQTQGYIPIIRDGARQLFGVLVVHKDSPIQNVSELDGKRISFPSPNALGASLLMRADLDSIHHIKFDPVFAATHTSSYLNVVLGRTAAAGGVMGTFNKQKPEIKDQLRILYKTRKMPPHPVTVHPRVPEEDYKKVKKAFLDMAATEQGAALLAKIPMKKAVATFLAEYQILNQWGLEDYYVHPGE